MSLEDRINQAKEDKLLTKAPTLRRVILRTRWYGTIGGVVMVIAALKNLGESSLDESSNIGIVISVAGLLFSIAVLFISAGISRTADARDLPATVRLLMILKGILIFGLLLLLCGGIYRLVQVSEISGSISPLMLILLFLPLLIFAVWIHDVVKSKKEIESLRV